MVPEVKIITPADVTAQQGWFNTTTEKFGQEYARGQNQFKTGRNLLAKLTGNPAPAQQIRESIVNLTEARLNLAEVRARRAAQGAPDDATYQQLLAANFAREYFVTGQQVLTNTQTENSNLGIVDDIYRANSNQRGSELRLAGGLALITVATGTFNLIQGPNAATVTEIGIFIAATGALDTARQIFLGSFNRSRVNLAVASVTSLIRRRASVHEGQITGDEVDGSLPMDQQLEQRLAVEILEQLQLDTIRRPDLINPTDHSDILRQRTSLRRRLPGYEDVPELVRSRDSARTGRLARTVLAVIVAGGLGYHHFTRFEDCGSRTFIHPDTLMQQSTGAKNVSSLKGMAQNELFKSIYGRDFDPKNPDDRKNFDKTLRSNPVTYGKIVDEITEQIKRKNPNATIIGDIIIWSDLNDVCKNELKGIYDTTPKPLSR